MGLPFPRYWLFVAIAVGSVALVSRLMHRTIVDVDTCGFSIRHRPWHFPGDVSAPLNDVVDVDLDTTISTHTDEHGNEHTSVDFDVELCRHSAPSVVICKTGSERRALYLRSILRQAIQRARGTGGRGRK